MLVVLNADDFGTSPDTVRATIECFEQDALTSATIMAAMPATDAAVSFALEHAELSFGVHLTFTGDGLEAPVSDPGLVRDLVDREGRFLPTRAVRRLALMNRLPQEQIERELEAQIGVVRETGVVLSHVDSHRHLHKFKPFREALARVLPRFGIERVRNAQDIYLRRPLRSPTFWLGAIWRRRLMERFMTTEHFYMPASAGDTAWNEPLLPIVRRLEGRFLEIGVHPGFDETWRDGERLSVQRFASSARREGHRLVSWREVAAA